MPIRPAAATPRRFSPSSPGLYRVHAEARRGAATLGAADRWMYVGGADREFADPRLNEGFLRRVARNSGGRYVRAADASKRAGAGCRRRCRRTPRPSAAISGTSRGRSRWSSCCCRPSGSCAAAGGCDEFGIQNSECRIRRCCAIALRPCASADVASSCARRRALRAGRHRRVGRRRLRAEVREVARRRSSTRCAASSTTTRSGCSSSPRRPSDGRAEGDPRERPRARSPICASG